MATETCCQGVRQPAEPAAQRPSRPP